jgi:P27 family predicted phage terminase small subunit
VQPGEPEMPKLSREAAQEWKRIVPELLRLKVLTVIDGMALAAYCQAYARWQQAERDVKRYGITVRESVLKDGEPTGYVRLKRNPAIGVANDALKIMKSFLIEFGMTPAARTRIHVEIPSEQDPFDRYIADTYFSPDKSTKIAS